MDLIEILNEDGSGSGLHKKRADVHRDGDLHGSAHVWLIRNVRQDGRFEVLLQRRSDDKDSYPGCLDTSSAGHVDVGETFRSAAERELAEELGITEMDALMFLFDHRVYWEAQFHGSRFVNNEISRIYALVCDRPAEAFLFQREEISSLCWQDAHQVLAALRDNDPRYCIHLPIFERLAEAVQAMRHYTIHVSDYASAPDAGSYAGSDEWTYHETYDFFGTETAAAERAQQYVKAFHEDVSPYLASVTWWLTD